MELILEFYSLVLLFFISSTMGFVIFLYAMTDWLLSSFLRRASERARKRGQHTRIRARTYFSMYPSCVLCGNGRVPSPFQRNAFFPPFPFFSSPEFIVWCVVSVHRMVPSFFLSFSILQQWRIRTSYYFKHVNLREVFSHISSFSCQFLWIIFFNFSFSLTWLYFPDLSKLKFGLLRLHIRTPNPLER